MYKKATKASVSCDVCGDKIESDGCIACIECYNSIYDELESYKIEVDKLKEELESYKQ